MIAIFTFIIFTLTSISVYFIASYSMQDTFNQNQAIMYNDNKGREVKQKIINSAISIGENGAIYLPAGSISDRGWSTIPDWVSKTAYSDSGVPLLYCPFSLNQSSGGNSSVVLPNDTEYRVETAVGYNNARYVLTSSYIPENNILGIIVSPIGKDDDMPNCYDYQFRNGQFYINNGQIWGITQSDLTYSQNGGSSVNRVSNQVDPGASPQNTEPGLNSSSLSVNIGRFTNPASSIEEIYLYLGSGDFIVNDLKLFINDNFDLSDSRKKITLIGNEGDRATIRTEEESPLIFNMPNTELVLKNIIFNGSIQSSNNKILLQNSDVNYILGESFDIEINNSNIGNDDISLNISQSSIENFGNNNFHGNLILKNETTFYSTQNNNNINMDGYIEIMGHSNMNISDSDFILNGQGVAIYNKHGGNLSISDSNIIFNGDFNTLVRNEGTLNILGNSGESRLQLTGSAGYGISFLSGSQQTIERAYVFSSESEDKPSYSAYITGDPLYIGGNNALFSGNIACWNVEEGNAFETSSGSSSNRGNRKTINNLSNSSNWSCS